MRKRLFFGLKELDLVLMGLSLIGVLFCSIVLSFEPAYQFFFNDQKERSQSKVIGKIMMVQNDIRYRSKSSIKWEKVNEKDQLYLGDSVFTGNHSHSIIHMVEGSQLTVDENSLIHFVKTHNLELPRLAFGKFQLKVQGKVKLIINNRLTEISGQNSAIEMVVRKDQTSEVKVKAGSVIVSRDSQETPLAANESIQIQPVIQSEAFESDRKVAQVEDFSELSITDSPQFLPLIAQSSLNPAQTSLDPISDSQTQSEPFSPQEERSESPFFSTPPILQPLIPPIFPSVAPSVTPSLEPLVSSSPPSPSDGVQKLNISGDSTHESEKPDAFQFNLFRSHYFKSRLGVEFSVLTQLSQDQIIAQVSNPIILNWGINGIKWKDHHGVGGRIKSRGANIEDPDGQNLNTLAFEMQYRYRWTSYLNPFLQNGFSQLALICGFEHYKNYGKNFYSSGYDLLKTGFSLNLPFAHNWYSETEFLYGKTKGFDESLEFIWNFGFLYSDDLSLVVGYRIYLFNARSKSVTPLGVLPYREGSIEGIGAIQWSY